jgi:hypothetical protein
VRGYDASTNRDVNLYLDHPQTNGGAVVEVVTVEFWPFAGSASRRAARSERLSV